MTVEPALTVALTRHLRASGGVSLSSLESLHRSPDSQMASAVTGSLVYRQRWDRDRRTHQDVEAGYEVRSAVDGLGSDSRTHGTSAGRGINSRAAATPA